MINYLDQDLFQYGGIWGISDECSIFPIGKGWEIALRTIASYPSGTKLYELEEVIGLKMLINKPRNRIQGNPYDEKFLHCAIWCEDILALAERGFIKGAVPATEFEWELRRFQILINQGLSTNENGDIVCYLGDEKKKTIIPRPKLENYIEEYSDEALSDEDRAELIEEYNRFKPFVFIPFALELSEKGRKYILENSQVFEIPQRIEQRIRPLIEISYYDTAIREVAILFEAMLKKFHKSTLFGEELIEFHIDKCISANQNQYAAGIKIYRQELRKVNRFIRNEYLHNLKEVDQTEFYSILYKQCSLFKLMEQAFKKLLEM
jgi:hypothetical protein